MTPGLTSSLADASSSLAASRSDFSFSLSRESAGGASVSCERGWTEVRLSVRQCNGRDGTGSPWL